MISLETIIGSTQETIYLEEFTDAIGRINRTGYLTIWYLTKDGILGIQSTKKPNLECLSNIFEHVSEPELTGLSQYEVEVNFKGLTVQEAIDKVEKLYNEVLEYDI